MKHCVILTGVTGGLGKEIFKTIIENNDINYLCAIYRNYEKFSSMLNEYEEIKPEIIGICQELSDYKININNYIKDYDIDKITLVLNAFKILPIQLIGNFKEDEILNSIRVNVESTVILVNQVVKYIKSKDIKLNIINLDSGAAYFALKGWGNYCAGKAYCNMFLKTLILENEDIDIISYDPGVMDTQMQSNIRAVSSKIFDKVDEFVKYKEQGILSSPDLVAKDIYNKFIINWHTKEFNYKYTRGNN